MSLIESMTNFETWWYHEGSGPPLPDEDVEEFAKRICQIAWDKSAQAEREACAKVCDTLAVHPEYSSDVTKLAALAIRARRDS